MPSRRPARPTVGAPARPDRATSTSRRATGSVGTGGTGRGRATRGRAPGGRTPGLPATPLLGGDEVAVVRLATMDDLDLGAGHKVVDPPRERLGPCQVGALA